MCGYNYKIEPTIELAIRRKSNNQFISLIESINSFTTVFSKKHSDWADDNRRIIIEDKLWLQIIHKNNIINNMSWSIWFTNNYKILKDFSISENYKNPGIIDILKVMKKNFLIILFSLIKKNKISKKSLLKNIFPFYLKLRKFSNSAIDLKK